MVTLLVPARVPKYEVHPNWVDQNQCRRRVRRDVEQTFTVEEVDDVAFDLAVLFNQLFALFLVVERVFDWEQWTCEV